MKVICIDASDDPAGFEGKKVITEGGIYTVIEHIIAVGTDGSEIPGYELAEDIGWGYAKSRFIPLSSINETEMVREYNLEKIS